jgi:hypothetical protein
VFKKAGRSNLHYLSTKFHTHDTEIWDKSKWSSLRIKYEVKLFINSFIAYLKKLSQWLRIHSTELNDNRWMMNCKTCRRKRSWLNLSNYPGICMERLRKASKYLSQDSRSPGQDLNPGTSKYEAGVLITRPRRLVINLWRTNEARVIFQRNKHIFRIPSSQFYIPH